MRKLLAVAVCATGVGLFGACGSNSSGGGGDAGTSADGGDGGLDPVEGCKQIQAITCDKVFKCYSSAELDAAKDRIGLNAADCTVKFSATCIPEMVNCSAGETFHGDKLAACVDGFRTFTCDDIKRMPVVEPAACALFCTK